MKILIDGEDMADLLENKAITYRQTQFDMNDGFTGFLPFNGKKPKNAPEEIGNWGLAASFPLDKNNYVNNIIQFIFDLNGTFMFRSLDGSSGVMTWSRWKQIGGVLRKAKTLMQGTLKGVLA